MTIEQIATDFVVRPMTLTKWMRPADIDEGAKPDKSTSESGELRETRRQSSCWNRADSPGGALGHRFSGTARS